MGEVVHQPVVGRQAFACLYASHSYPCVWPKVLCGLSVLALDPGHKLPLPHPLSGTGGPLTLPTSWASYPDIRPPVVLQVPTISLPGSTCSCSGLRSSLPRFLLFRSGGPGGAFTSAPRAGHPGYAASTALGHQGRCLGMSRETPGG